MVIETTERDRYEQSESFSPSSSNQVSRDSSISPLQTLPTPKDLYNELRKRWQAIIARHPYGIAHRFESKGTEIFHALMAWAWEFDNIVGHLSDDNLGEHIRDRRDVEMMINWIDDLGDLLEEDENCVNFFNFDQLSTEDDYTHTLGRI